MRRTFAFRITLTVIALAFVAIPALALDQAIEHGSDIWQTRPDGMTKITFDNNPLPADFFCTGSQPFFGRVVMQGVPIATLPEGVLGRTDTIVQRLDNAAFDENGIATTRIQVTAIHLRSVQPLRNQCGAFRLDMTLTDGEQPVGEMKIVRQGANFGYYETDLGLNFTLTFTPVDRDGPTLEVQRSIHFPKNRNFWASQPGEGGVQFTGFVSVDTDANGEADTFIPGTSSNFAPGWHGPREGLGTLHRETAGAQVSGSLKGAPSMPQLVTPEQELRSLTGAQTATVEPICTNELCHCDVDGTHCQTATIAAQ
jgi:hypothetical protein